MSILYELAGILDNARQSFESIPKGCEELNAGDIVCCDNLDFLSSHFGSGQKIDFIYIDPPFFTGADYKARIVEDDGVSTPLAYSDRWESLSDFLKNMSLRLLFMKELLADSGLIAVHLDNHSAHYIKVIMDEIFGQKRFVNEIIWSYKSGGSSKKSFAKKHDTILLYSKTRNYYFSAQKEISYNRKGRPYHFKGVEEFQDENGRWYTLVNRRDVLSVDMVGRTSSERTGYATQKPEKLLEILIESCCPEDGLCADFFCGSGSLGAAAARLGRRYILCDRSPLAVSISRDRLETNTQLSFL